MSYWWAHAVICAFACIFIKKISKYYITWILIANAYLFSNQTRFSSEFLFIALGLSAWALSDYYLRTTKKQRFCLILSMIVVSTIMTTLGKSLNEKFALLAWLPVLVSFFFPPNESASLKNNSIATSISVLLTFFSSKKQILLGFFTQYFSAIRSWKSILIFAVSLIAIFSSGFIFKKDLSNFYKSSFKPKFTVWQASTNGFFSKPLGGNGFGIYPMEINTYRDYAKNMSGKLKKHLSHAHSNFLHIAFEQGVIGLAIFTLLLIFLFKNHPACFWTFLSLSIIDANLIFSSQYLIASMIFLPSIINNKPVFDSKYFVIPTKYQNFAYQLILFLCLISFGFSIIGHYFYDARKYSMAVKMDSEHPLYHFFLGVKDFKKNKLGDAIVSFERSIYFAKNHGFQQGFLAVSYHMLQEQKKSVAWMSRALRLYGSDPQWKYIAHVLYENLNPGLSKKLKTQAIKESPVLSYYDKGIMPPKLSSIGGLENSYLWINSYQRRGEKVFLPTPQI